MSEGSGPAPGHKSWGPGPEVLAIEGRGAPRVDAGAISAPRRVGSSTAARLLGLRNQEQPALEAAGSPPVGARLFPVLEASGGTRVHPTRPYPGSARCPLFSPLATYLEAGIATPPAR